MKRLTISVSDEFFVGLKHRVGKDGAGPYLESLTRQHVVPSTLEEQYREAAQDEEAEREALEWIEDGVGECLPDDDLDWLRDAKRRGLVGRAGPGGRRRNPQDETRGDHLE